MAALEDLRVVDQERAIHERLVVLGQHRLDIVSLSWSSLHGKELDPIDLEFPPLLIGQDGFDLMPHVAAFVGENGILANIKHIHSGKPQVPEVLAEGYLGEFPMGLRPLLEFLRGRCPCGF